MIIDLINRMEARYVTDMAACKKSLNELDEQRDAIATLKRSFVVDTSGATRKGRIYIAGPMTGYDQFNYPRFFEIEEQLKKQGWKVENPARLGNMPNATWEDYMQCALSMMLTCSAVFLLDGWEKSKGATIEMEVASKLDMQVLFENDLHATEKVESGTF